MPDRVTWTWVTAARCTACGSVVETAGAGTVPAGCSSCGAPRMVAGRAVVEAEEAGPTPATFLADVAGAERA